MTSNSVKHLSHIFLLLFTCISGIQADKGTALLPYPQQVSWLDCNFTSKEITLSVEDSLQWILNDWLSENPIIKVPDSKKTLTIRITDHMENIPINQVEAYHLWVDSTQIVIEAISEKGIYWAIQTLRQLTVKDKNAIRINGCKITDWPAFRIRGFMQDTGRSFISMDELKREIATLSRYKINVFHWHLTENQAWRLESKRFPMLNDSINMTRMPGKYYTQEEARELVNFCNKHNVLLIPEIEMPGHSEAFTRTFQYDMQSEEGMHILKQLMDEVCEIFNDVPYIHVGTDEVEFTNPLFVPEMVAHVRKNGKKVISWNPGWPYKKGEIDMLQLWSYRGKEQESTPAIDSRFHYINHFDAFADVIALYNSRILNVDYGSYEHAGCIIALWHDRYIESEHDIIIQNNFYPSALALAERAWRGKGSEYFDKNGTMLPDEKDSIFKTFQDFEERMLWHKKNILIDYPFAYVKQTNVKWRITGAFPNNKDLTKIFPPEKGLKTKYSYNGKTYETNEATGATIYLRHVWGALVPAFYKDPEPNHTAYAYTYVYSDKTQDVGLWVNFQNYGRSEKDLPPPQGKWDYKESWIRINDKELPPPVWLSGHTEKSNEIPLTNENFEARPPIRIKLNKGWNKVLLKLPVGEFTTHEIRLVKWMFTCVFVTPDGKNEVEGLIYSPDKKRH